MHLISQMVQAGAYLRHTLDQRFLSLTTEWIVRFHAHNRNEAQVHSTNPTFWKSVQYVTRVLVVMAVAPPFV